MRLEPSPVEAMCKHYIWLVWLLFAGPSLADVHSKGLSNTNTAWPRCAFLIPFLALVRCTAFTPGCNGSPVFP